VLTPEKIHLLQDIRWLIEDRLHIELTPEACVYLDRTLLEAITRPMCNVFEIKNRRGYEALR